MRIKITDFAFLTIAALAFSVSGDVIAQQPQKTAVPDTKADEAVAVEDSTHYARPEFDYKSKGKRDPFSSLAPVIDTETVQTPVKGLFNYEGAALKGIVRSGDDFYALVRDEHDYSYVLRRGYKVFGGYVTDITEDTIKLHLVKYGRTLNIIFRLEDSKSTIEEVVGPSELTMKKPGIDIRYSKEKQVGETATISVEDIALSSLGTKTVDEIWFKSGSTDISEEKDDETSEAQAAFSMIDPPNGGTIDLPYEMNWSHVNSGAVTYSVVFDDNNDFSSPLLMIGGIETSSCLLKSDVNLPSDRKIFWKVTAHDERGSEIKSRQNFMSFKIR